MKCILFSFCIICLAGVHALCDPAENMEFNISPSLISSIRVEPPLTFCGEEVPIHMQQFRERLELELLISLSNRARTILWLKRSHRYMPHIENVLKLNNLPDDLKYLPVIESDLRPHAGSPKNAMGFWQFIESTGEKYGLTIDRNIDERRDFFASTEAAVRYLKKLYTDFNSWTLAAAAYNMGEDRLKEEILSQGTDNYYNLYLFKETQRYVFRAIAAKLILSKPEQYGIMLTESDLYPPVQFERVTLECTEQIPVSIIAQTAGTYYSVIKNLNPAIRGRSLESGTYSILIPKGSSDKFNNSLLASVRPLKKEKASLKDPPPKTDLPPLLPQSTFPYTIHVSSARNLKKAYHEAMMLKKNGEPAYLSSICIEDKGVWYRTYIGAFSTFHEAGKVAEGLRKGKFTYAKVERLPWAVQVNGYNSLEEFQEIKTALQSKNYISYALPCEKESNDISQLLIGAFKTENEAILQSDVLSEMGFETDIIIR